MNVLPSDPEKLLRDAIDQLVPLLSAPDLYREYAIGSIGSIACCVAVLDSTQEGMDFAADRLDETGVGPDEEFDAWMKLASIQVPRALSNARESAGITTSDDAYHLRPDLHGDMRSLYRITELVGFGDTRGVPLVHELLPAKRPLDDSIVFRPRVAYKLYEAGDMTAADLAAQTAQQAMQYVLAQLEAEEKAPQKDADIFPGLIEAVLGHRLSPRLNGLERAYAQADIALWGLAVHALSLDRPEDAEKVRAEILSIEYGALVDAEFCATGNDPQGTHFENIADALDVYADDLQTASLKITHRLVAGGYAQWLAVYEAAFLRTDSVTLPEHHHLEALAVMAKLDIAAAKRRLLEMVEVSDYPEQYIQAFEDAGMEAESIALAKRLYARSPSRLGALAILNREFSLELWREMVQYPNIAVSEGNPGMYYRTKDIMMLARYVTGRTDLPFA